MLSKKASWLPRGRMAHSPIPWSHDIGAPPAAAGPPGRFRRGGFQAPRRNPQGPGFHSGTTVSSRGAGAGGTARLLFFTPALWPCWVPPRIQKRDISLPAAPHCFLCSLCPGDSCSRHCRPRRVSCRCIQALLCQPFLPSAAREERDPGLMQIGVAGWDCG